MPTRELRQRYLAAMGLSSAFLAAACSANEGGTTPEVTATSTADATTAPVDSTPPVTTATAAATATATTAPSSAPPASKVTFWEPTVPPKGPSSPPLNHMPRCPDGDFCIAEADAGGKEIAAAPYGKCAESVADPMAHAPMSRSISFDAGQTKLERTAKKDACCYHWVIPCPGGRPLVVEGAPRVAPSTSERAWVSRAADPFGDLRAALPALPEGARSALAAHYAREASFEHASVAAFARVSLSMLAAGAPPDLVADTHRAALDEIAHAEAMYQLASAHLDAPIGPSSLDLGGAPGALTGLDDIAEEALFEGCASEVAAALVLREEAARATHASARDALLRMADDEERHAELAWRTVAWALSRSPELVAPKLVAARLTFQEELAAPDVGDASLTPLPGLTSAAERRAIKRRAIADVVLPCLDALTASRSGLRSS